MVWRQFRSTFFYSYIQCGGAENISFGSKQIRVTAAAPAQLQINLIRYRSPDNYLFDLSTSTFLHGLIYVVPKYD